MATIQFEGPLVFPRETLLAEIAEDTKSFYTAGRLASAQRRLEDFYKKRGYFTVTVEASGDPASARDGKVRALFRIEPGPIYRFDGVTVSGTKASNRHSSRSVFVDCKERFTIPR